ncbi:hypothetical protein EXIGLDRAFT_721134 [Exidia glandulosa HHB12029]|uniref:Uncharacterized protein n=1 Tax=Exidia glandulosa HHB12029 TaxID=1314781 RepID=A0A165FWL6_EXIGL|nr:hypothetical protein EXIGLDRAFT_721134 [Exidia glandulosa HHB12029]
MRSWDRAPPEILLRCFESLGTLSTRIARVTQQRYPSLIACSLVCRSWLPCAQSVLLYCVVPRETEYTAVSWASVKQLVSVLADGSERGAALAREVKVLKLQLGVDMHHCGSEEQHADLESLALLVHACQNLQSLYLTQSALTPPTNIFDARQLSLIRTQSSITHLELICDSNPPAIMHQCLNSWPSLTTLRIVAWSLPAPPRHLPPSCSLRELTAETYGEPSGLILSAARCLESLTCTLNALRVIEHVSETLRSLTVDCTFPLRASTKEMDTALGILSRCSALERVTFRGGCPDDALEALPPTVTHLRILCSVDATRLANFIDSRPTLTHVDVQMICLRVRDDLARLHRVCRSQHIQLGRVHE